MGGLKDFAKRKGKVGRFSRRKIWLFLFLLILGLLATCLYAQGFLQGTRINQSRVGKELAQPFEETSASQRLVLRRERSSNETLDKLIKKMNQLVKTAAKTAQKIEARFYTAQAIKHIKIISGEIGVRQAGSKGESQAADYIEKVLSSYGYEVKRQKFELPNGRSSENLIAIAPGQLDRVLILGAHYDSKPPSPGANDNASGVGVLLELARIYKIRHAVPTIKFIFFGAEEMIDTNPDHHHYGSRHYVAHLSPGEKEKIFGMFSVDMVGYGNNFHVRTMKRGSQSLVKKLLSLTRQKGFNLTFRKDEGRYGWSVHEPFELAGIPAAWLEWRNDPYYHTPRDTYIHIRSFCVETTGKLIISFLSNLSEEKRD